MATLIPIAANDAQNAAFMTRGGDKKAFTRMGNKYVAIAKNPGKSAWKTFKSIFGFGMITIHRRGKGAGTRKGKPTHRKRK